jgi:hypothetical protein
VDRGQVVPEGHEDQPVHERFMIAA